MSLSVYEKNLRRKQRVRWSLKKAGRTRPRLSIFCSNKHVYAQIIDDISSSTLLSASSLEKELRDTFQNLKRRDIARIIGARLAERAVAKGIETVKFDRGSYQYTGRVKDFADSARSAGLQF